MGHRDLIKDIFGEDIANNYKFSEGEFIEDFLVVMAGYQEKIHDRVIYTIMSRYEIGGHKFKTYAGIGREYDRSAARIRATFFKSRHQIRHPSRSRFIRQNKRLRDIEK